MNLTRREPHVEAETLWHQCLLVAILVIAACARFYSLDQISLSPTELTNLTACDAATWSTRVEYFLAYNGLPPLYPTLLCQFSDLFDAADFALRALSVLAGLATIYMLYLMGRDFLSPSAGLLAAAFMASSYQAIQPSREVSITSLQVLCYFAHSYCFCHLFFFNNSANRPFKLSFAGTRSHFEWHWQPAFPGDGRYVVGFWFTGALAFYTNAMSLILLAGELLVSVVLVNTLPALNQSPQHRRQLLRSLWMPILIISLPWLPTLYGYTSWVAQGYLFAFHSAAELQQKLRPFIPIDISISIFLVLLLLLFLIFLTVVQRRKKDSDVLQRAYIAYVLFHIFFALFTLWLFKNGYFSYLYYYWMLILLMMIPLTVVIHLIPQQAYRNSLLGLIIFMMVIFQFKFNVFTDLYRSGRNSDFRLAAKIIHDDVDFMKTDKEVYISSLLFKHYLDSYDITTSNLTMLDEISLPNDNHIPLDNSEFYYLEFRKDKDSQDETPTTQQLIAHYPVLCKTYMPRIYIAKFSRNNAVNAKPDMDCRSYSSDEVSSK